MTDLESIKQNYQNTKKELQKAEESLDWEKAGKLRKEQDLCKDILEKDQELQTLRQQIQEAEKILTTENDQELISLATEDKKQLTEQAQVLEKELSKLIKQATGQAEDEFDAIIVEIRAGTGGEEAALFAGDLFYMYARYAENNGWKMKILQQHQTELKGYKEIVFSLAGENVYAKLKHEAGVHRVQRIPTTEKSGRIHTSTASVAVLPQAKKTQARLKPDDLETSTYKSSGPGGQYVNKRETAVRIKHIPTGIVVSSQTERSLLQNKENALAILEAKVLEKQKEIQEQKLGSKRRNQIGQAERSEKIRTYNFPQNRITDHRIKKAWHNLDIVMTGELNEIATELQKHQNKEIS